MDFMLALNVTIYGLGIVFLALLVLMVVIMLLGKAFAVVTGKDILAVAEVAPPTAPSPAFTAPAGLAPLPQTSAAEAVNAPLPGKVLSVAVKMGDHVSAGDELCVIEAMKMGNSVKAPRDGFVVEVCVTQGNTVAFGAPLVRLASSLSAPTLPTPPPAAPAAPAPTASGEPSAFTLTASGKTHAVELASTDGGGLTVALDGARYEVRRDSADRTKLMVNGRTHTVDVKEIAGTTVTVMIDGTTQKLEMGQREKSASRTVSVTSGGKTRKAEVAGSGGAATVALDGTSYRVERDKTDPSRIIVNGQAHTVDVKEIAGTTVTVMIDGRTEKVQIATEAAAASTPAAAPIAPPASASVSTAGSVAPVTAPLPGKVISVAVKVGDRVKRGDELCVIEAMKMGNSIKAQRDGVVRDVLVAAGQTVPFGAALVVLE